MALTAAGLKAEIISALDSVAPTADADSGESGSLWREQFAQAVATAVIDYLKSNAEVVSVSPLPVMHPLGPGAVQPFTLTQGTALK